MQMQEAPVVMVDLGGPFDRAASDDKFDGYRDGWSVDGISRWAIAVWDNKFLGYVGITRHTDQAVHLARNAHLNPDLFWAIMGGGGRSWEHKSDGARDRTR